MNYYLKEIFDIAKDGGYVLTKYFGKNIKYSEKNITADILTKADLESEDVIIKKIEEKFPEYNIYSEERKFIDKKSAYTFVIDPLDGSMNFVLGIPYFSISIALMQNKNVLYSVIYSPILKNLYYAQKGKGSYLNGKKIRVSKNKKIEKSIVSYSSKYKKSKDNEILITKKLFNKNVKRVLFNWSPSLDLCLLASGKIDVFISNNNEIYDFLAGKLIVKEAGARVFDFKGQKESDDMNSTFFICNNLSVKNELIKIL